MAGYNVTKRVSALRRQADESRAGQWPFRRTAFIAFLILGILTYFVAPQGPEEEEGTDTWQADLQREFTQRLNWLDGSPLVFTPGAAPLYNSFGRSIVSSLAVSRPADKAQEEMELVDLTGMEIWVSRMFTSALLRLGFIFIAFLPLWLIALAAGFFMVRSSWNKKKSGTVLGVCDRGRSPFYSGIYGPFRPNNSFSGTDFSCPGLACPEKAPRKAALEHRLVKLLRDHGALNETNLELAEIILAHRDYPGEVEEESSPHEEQEPKGIADDGPERVSQTGFVTNEKGTLEQQALGGLSAILEAHQRISKYVKSLEEKGVKSSVLNSSYPTHIANLEKLCAAGSPLTKLLVMSLTPNRIWASSHLQPQIVATAYLAIEAGKSLVYKRHSQGFVRISIFPHLQARAVVNSVAPFHSEYTGDQRVIIRQAIICSRRHGDFGRAFLPTRMPVESRVLRDWLEILYSDAENLQDTGNLVELDAHIEEININWRVGFARRLRQEVEAKERDDTPAAGQFWKGVSYKSVVLMPVKNLVEISLRGIHDDRRKRISELLALTRRHQTRISISARLPGFKRQALEADKSGEEADRFINPLTGAEERDFSERWRIVRRMLTKYNWLSTRIGDDAVPLSGLISAVHQPPEGGAATVLDSLVPLRQRRFVELFGRAWESIYYPANPNPEELEIYIEPQKLVEAVKALPAPADTGQTPAVKTETVASA